MSKRSRMSPEYETFKGLLEADAALFEAAKRLRGMELEKFALRVDEVREAIADECHAIQASVYKKLSQAPVRVRAN